MPLVIHPRVRKAVQRGAAVTILAVLAGAGTALADCPAQPTSTPFAQWGDTNNYFLVPGGSFEGSSDQVGWQLHGASLTPGNEPFQVDGAGDGQALTIDGGGHATSPFFCVDDTMSNLRFFAQEVTGGAGLHVSALVQTPNGITRVPVGQLADSSSATWAPTEPISGDSSAIPSGESVMVALRFSVPWSGGSWQIDDIYVDPWRSG